MANKYLLRPYDPLLEPERSVLQRKVMLMNDMRGTKRHARMGEEHIVSCACGELIVTNDAGIASAFTNTHWERCSS
jgi:hypothetical protein